MRERAPARTETNPAPATIEEAPLVSAALELPVEEFEEPFPDEEELEEERATLMFAVEKSRIEGPATTDASAREGPVVSIK